MPTGNDFGQTIFNLTYKEVRIKLKTDTSYEIYFNSNICSMLCNFLY